MACHSILCEYRIDAFDNYDPTCKIQDSLFFGYTDGKRDGVRTGYWQYIFCIGSKMAVFVPNIQDCFSGFDEKETERRKRKFV